MASSKNAKQRRQAQNRAERERLAARTEAAREKAKTSAPSQEPARRSRLSKVLNPAPAESGAGSRGSAGSSTRGGSARGSAARGSAARGSAGGAARGSATSGRLTPKPVRPGPDFLRRFGYEEPGGRAVHLGALLTIAASVVALFWKMIAVDKAGNIVKKGHHYAEKVNLLTYQGPKAFLFVGAPVLVALVTVLFSRPATRKRTWGFGALALFVWCILGGVGAFYYIPAAAMGLGWWQAGKQEREARMEEAQKARQRKQAAARRGGRPQQPASGLGGLFKRREVVDTTATEASTEVDGDDAYDDAGYEDAGYEDAGYEDDGYDEDDEVLDGGEVEEPAAPRGRRPKPTKADVAAAIEAGRRGNRRGARR